MARRKTVFKVRNFSEAISRGSKGAADKPSKTIARSQARSLVRIADLSLRVPRINALLEGSSPRMHHPKGHGKPIWPPLKPLIWKGIALPKCDLVETLDLNPPGS